MSCPAWFSFIIGYKIIEIENISDSWNIYAMAAAANPKVVRGTIGKLTQHFGAVVGSTDVTRPFVSFVVEASHDLNLSFYRPPFAIGLIHVRSLRQPKKTRVSRCPGNFAYAVLLLR